MKKIILILFFLLSSLFFLPHSALADDKFDTSYNVTYTVNDAGITHATANVVITNKTTNFYVSSYSIKLGFTEIDNLHVSDSGGAIVPIVTTTPDGEEIALTFNTVVYGVGTTLPFTISFDTPDVASKNGNIWEVNIPGISNQNDFTSFGVHVVVPPDFGKPTYIKPDTGSLSLDFTKDQLGKSGVSIAFGSKQEYEFHLAYHLENKALFPIRTTIALPPTTNYQTVAITSMDPKPTNVYLDKDGNWLADYILSPSQKITPVVTGIALLSLTPSPSALSESDRKIYLEDKPYWQVNNAKIKELADQLKTPDAIYQYVVHTLTYDYSRVTGDQNRLGALGVLQNPTSAVCLEFTDLFVALARAAGIPAREVDGFAYTQNTRERPLSLVKDILHAWPEYYDDSKGTWVMVDPTWENTTGGVDYFHVLDYDHIAFAIKGQDSNYPIPAGGYKLPGEENERDIAVNFSNASIQTSPVVTAQLDLSNAFLSAFPVQGTVVIKNTGQVLFPAQSFLVESFLNPKVQEVSFSAIPPFGSTTVGFGFNKTSLLTNAKGIVTINLAGKEISQTITVATLSSRQVIILGGAACAIFCLIIFAIATRPRRISIPQQKR